MDQRIVKVLKKLEDVAAEAGPDGRRNNFWNVPPETGNFLNILCRAVKARTVLEIGTSNGYSGLWFAEALSHTGGKLYTVESHRERFALARRNFEEAGAGGTVEQIFGHAPEIFSTPEFKAKGLKFDMVFLDATKMEYASYLEKVLPLMNETGILLADNVVSHAGEVQGFLAEVSQKKELRFSVLPLGSGLLMAARVPV